VREVPHGHVHNRKGPGIVEPILLVERQVPSAEVKIPLRESIEDLYDTLLFRLY